MFSAMLHISFFLKMSLLQSIGERYSHFLLGHVQVHIGHHLMLFATLFVFPVKRLSFILTLAIGQQTLGSLHFWGVESNTEMLKYFAVLLL